MGKKNKKKNGDKPAQDRKIEPETESGQIEEQPNGHNEEQLNGPAMPASETTDDQQTNESEAPEEEPETQQTNLTINENQRVQELEAQLAEAIEARETAQDEYESLLERISNIKATLGARLKSDDEKIGALQQRVQELQDDKAMLKSSLDITQKELSTAVADHEQVSMHLTDLQLETKKQNNEWASERDVLLQDRKRAIDRLEASESARRDLEIALADERVGKDTFTERVAGLQEQINTQTQYAERFRQERDIARTALTDTQREYEIKVREGVERIAQLEATNEEMQRGAESGAERIAALEAQVKADQERIAQLEHFEEEIKEKNLIVGKLRHEAVILNEHLVKALRMIKKDSEGDTVDKQLISNLILSFLSFPRGDTKKFETLQLISSCLTWDEEQKVQAGLSRSAMGPSFGTGPKRSISSSSLASSQGELGNGSTRFIGRLAEFFERDTTK